MNVIALADDRLLVGEGNALLIVEREATLQRGVRLEIGDLVRDIAVVGDRAYVAAGSAGLQIVDGVASAAPTLRGRLRLPGLPFALQVVGEHAYIAAAGAGGGLQIVDVADPARPRLRSSVPHYGSASGIAVRHKLAFVSGGLAGGLQIIDVSDPQAPLLRGELVTPGVAQGIVLVDDQAFLAAGFCGVQTIDISDPAQPQLLSASATPGPAVSLALSGSTLFVAASEGGLASFSIHGTTLQPGAELALPGLASDLALDGPTLYLAGGSAGVQQLGVGAAPELQATLPAFVPNGPLLARGNTLVVGQDSGLRLLDLAADDPLPTALSVATRTGALTTRGDALYVASAAKINVFDTTDPLTVTLRTTLTLSGTVRALTVADEGIYVAADRAGVIVLNAREPLSPTLSAVWPISVTARVVVISGTQALLVERDQISLRARVSGALIGRAELPAAALVQDVVLRGSYAYLATSDGLLVFDIGDPTRPTRVFRRSGFAAYGLAWNAELLYVATGSAGVQVYSLSDAAAPALRAVHRGSGPALDVALVGDTIYVAAEAGGLQRYSLRALPLQVWLPVVQ
jgi:hypothetical protein